MEDKKTPLYQKHIDHNAKMIEFCGWSLPLEYTSMLQEAKTVRVKSGLFDATHMGEILIDGQGAGNLLQQSVSNDISLLREGQMQYNLFLNEAGGVIDDCMVYCKGKDYLCVVNAVNKERVATLLRSQQEDDVGVFDQSDSFSLLSIQGPQAEQVVEAAFGDTFSSLPYLSFRDAGVENRRVLISRSGYTGEDGFEIYSDWQDACYWWSRLLEAGGNNIIPCGLGARDILRIEAGYPLYGHELDDVIDPYSAALGWAVKLDVDGVGKPALRALKNSGIKKRRVGFIMQERAVPRQGYAIYKGAQEVGVVTSGTYSPNINAFIGMAYVNEPFAALDTMIEIKIREKMHTAKVVKFPFVHSQVKAAKGKG